MANDQMSRARRLAAGLLSVALVALPACSKSGGSAKKGNGSGSTTTAAAPTTTVAKPLDSDNLADRLVTQADVGSDWQQEGQQYIGEDDVKASSSKSDVKEELFCDGKPAQLPEQTSTYHGVASVLFSQDGDYPILVEQLSTAEVTALDKDLQSFTDVYSNCGHATTKVTEGDLSDTVDAEISQFAIPNTGADKQYAYLITYDVFGHKVNYVDVLMTKGTTLVALEYNGIDQFDQVEMARLATAAINKLANPENADTSS